MRPGLYITGLSIAPLLLVLVAAVPEVSFPFSSQVPAVARVATPYHFQIAETTFTTDDDANISYALVDPPAWLNLNSDTRTLYGTPGQGDTGSNTFSISATDTVVSAYMSCTMVVSTNSPPQVAGNITEILVDSGVVSDPATLAMNTNSVFTIAFGKSFFIAGSDQVQMYYATLSDHTPLPSWLEFQESSLAFLGVAPEVSGGPQSWTINLIASDVVGFAGSVVQFKISVSMDQLVFEPQEETLTVEAGTPFSDKSLLGDLLLDGRPVVRSQIQSAVVQAPSWIALRNDTLDLEGVSPVEFQPQTAKVSVKDIYGDVATKTIYLRGQNASLFAGEVGNLTATAGKLFNYTIGRSLFSETNLNITVNLGTASSWLHYDADTLRLQGIPPIDAKPQAVMITVTAVSKATQETQSQAFGLDIQATSLGGTPTWSSATLSSSAASTSTSAFARNTPGAMIDDSSSAHSTTTPGVVIGIIIGCIALVALIVALLMPLCRRRRGREPGKLVVSKPKLLLPGDRSTGNWPMSEGMMETRDLEWGMIARDKPPLLDLPLRPSSLGVPGYRRSIASSMGHGEAALQDDPNIPVWGAMATYTPHHSYSAATELARDDSRASHVRFSQFARLSPKKVGSKVLQNRHSQPNNQGRTSVNGSVLRSSARRSRPSSGLSIGSFFSSHDCTSKGSIETHGTSLLSPRTSDFPKPPKSTKRNLCSIPTVSVQNVDNRHSIRLVNRSNPDSVGTVDMDMRPLAEKRQSFIRNRASSSVISPLFASSRRSSNIREEAALTRSSSNMNKISRDRSQRITFSGSSSLEPRPPTRNPRRLASLANSFVSNVDLQRHIPARLPRSPKLEAGAASVYTIDTGMTSTESSSSTGHLDDAAFTAQLALPRDERNWVRPGEASPTPSPSGVARQLGHRDAVRRRWANKLKRDSRGHVLSRDPSPVKLKGVAQRIRDFGKEKESGASKGGDRLSLLVSNDSFDGSKRMTRKVSEKDNDVVGQQQVLLFKTTEAQAGTGAERGSSTEGVESEWEDVSSKHNSIIGSLCELDTNREVVSQDQGLRNSFSGVGKAFI